MLGGARRMGGSTITMQVARLRLGLSTTTLSGKFAQMARALQYEYHYGKGEILEAYFNLAPYGGNIEGVGAAARIYFRTTSGRLTRTESLALAVVPQNPVRRSPLNGPDFEAARARMQMLAAPDRTAGPETNFNRDSAMKKFLFLLLALVLSVSVSCSDDKTGDTGGSMLSVTPTEIEFEAAGGSRLLDLRTDAGAWSLTQSDNTAWCTPALTSGKTSTSFAVTAIANESSKRSATLTFTAPGCDPVVVTVTQSGDASQDFEGEQVVAQPDAWDNRKRADISYQLLVYSFADGNGDKVGDLRGLTRRLDYIDALGASAVWLSPIHPAASYHGYDVLDYEAVNPAFGSDADLRAFIDAAHARGIRVYLDYVLNHTGKDHPWFKSAAASEGSPYRDRYIFSEDPQADIAAGRIDQIATEGAAGYDAGQWFSTDTGAGAAGRFKFVLDWTNADSPTVTVTETTDAADADNTQGGADDKYLYFGNGTSKRFYARGGNSYELTLDFDSDWGFLVRTSTTSWAAGTKYGAPDNRTIIRFGEPFTLMSNRSADPANVQFSLPTMYHSHFWTAAFADLKEIRQSTPTVH